LKHNINNLVADVGDIRARKPRSEGGHALGHFLNVVAELEVLEVHHVDLHASLDVRLVDLHLAIKAAGADMYVFVLYTHTHTHMQIVYIYI
jgi:hypothetical protein